MVRPNEVVRRWQFRYDALRSAGTVVGICGLAAIRLTVDATLFVWAMMSQDARAPLAVFVANR